MIKKQDNPIVLLILDGWGIAPKSPGNAIELAKKPNFDRLWKNYPHTKLQASGKNVGLPNHDPGNSEAGHMNIGAGRTVFQDVVIINRAIADKTFFENMALHSVANHVKANKSRLHVLGLVSDESSPHACLEHLFAVVEFAKQQKISKVFLHFITDGRDSPQRSAQRIINRVLNKLHSLNNDYDNFELVTLMGRFYAMDRAKNWQRTKQAYECLIDQDYRTFDHYKSAIEHSYNLGKTDEFLEPAIIDRGKAKFKDSRIKSNDAVIFTNLRSDRARQLTKTFVQKDFNKKNPRAFRRSKVLKNLLFCALTDFGPDLSGKIVTAFPGAKLIGTLPFLMGNYKQLYIAETEKYAHVTYFLNGGYPDPVNREHRIRIPSVKIENYKDKPEMSVYEITKKIVDFIENNRYNFIVANFANSDMVGHSGDIKATIKAVEHMDICLGKVAQAVLNKEGTLIIIADHGNAEQMLDPKSSEFFVQHSTNKVPFILVNKKYKNIKLKEGCLCDVAPTIYDLFNVKSPKIVTGESLVKNKK